jgi:hypothetical protein
LSASSADFLFEAIHTDDRIQGHIQIRQAQFCSPQDGLCPRLRGFAHAGKREGFRERRSLSRFVQLETWRLSAGKRQFIF